MAQVSVAIGGRSYRLACEPGQEARLEALAKAIDEKIGEMKKSFGEVGDQRLTVMAALSVADEAAESQQRMAELEAQNVELRREAANQRSQAQRQQEATGAALAALAGRIDGLTARLAESLPE